MPDPIHLIDGRLLLRRPQIEDLSAVTAAVRESIRELKPWMPWAYEEYSESDTRRWIESLPASCEAGFHYDFLIVDSQDGAILGGCGLSHINPTYRLANLGYWVRTSQVGQGIASQAARLAACFGFEVVSLVRVEIVVGVGNAASLRAAEKAGAQREGILRNRMMVGKAVMDAVMHSLVPQDFGLPAVKE